MSNNGHVVTSLPVGESHATRLELPDAKPAHSARAKLDGNIARRTVKDREFFWWDTELPGFGLRTFPGGAKSWFVQFRQRNQQKRVTLGKPPEMSAQEARAVARGHLAKVALDGLPAAPKAASTAAGTIRFRDYAPRFWKDYARHWKPSTCTGNHSLIFQHLVREFGDMRVDAIRRTDILRWRDSWAHKSGSFNRTIPVMSVMMRYAEQLGLRPPGSNPCKGTPRYKRKPVDRFLSVREFKRLAASLRAFEDAEPRAVQAIRLLIFTGARRGEIEGLRWEWIQPPRIMLPDSKTGAKIIYLNRQAQAIIDALPGKAASGVVFPSRRVHGHIALHIPWYRIRAHAALPDVRLHDLRHSFASIAIADGVSLVVIGKLLGHALAETTERYAHLVDEAIADAAKRVSGSLAQCLGIAA